MDNNLRLPQKPEIPEDITERRLAAIEAITTYTENATNTNAPLASELYAIIYRFLPYHLKDYEVNSLQNFIKGYSNDYIVTHILKQLQKAAALMYAVEVYKDTDPLLNEYYPATRERSAKILHILNTWLKAQNDKTAVQIAELDELTAEDFREAAGWNLAANFHLFDLMRSNASAPKRIEHQGMIYDMNNTPDKIHYISDIFAYMMWKQDRVDNLEVAMAFYASPLDHRKANEQWWEERPDLLAEQAQLEIDDFAAAFAREKNISFHQSIAYFASVIKFLSDSEFLANWQTKFLGDLNPNVLQTFGFMQSRLLLKSVFTGLLGEECTDQMIEEILTEINNAKGTES